MYFCDLSVQVIRGEVFTRIHEGMQPFQWMGNKSYPLFNDYGFDNIDPHIVRYFRNEYGKDWRSALTEHLYKKERSNDKKAA